MDWARLCRSKSEGRVGFRDMASFNLALLAKQAWRIITLPDLLLTRILKVRYFPSSFFFVADLGELPLLTWRSTLLARPHLEAGLKKRIGNGENTFMWGDAWLLSEGSGKLITTRLFHSAYPDRVRDFIDWAVGEWDLAKISQHLWPCDVERVWLWGLQLPPKVRTFLWIACNDIVPIQLVLMKRQVGGDPYCPFCRLSLETTTHIFFECSWFKRGCKLRLLGFHFQRSKPIL